MVVATRNRRDALERTLAHLRDLPERPRVVVVDNGSSDGSAASARRYGVDVVELGRNAGPAARNVGVRRVGAPYVAFADDDSWWAPDALEPAAKLFDRYDSLALVAARVLVGPEEEPDPVSLAMAESPLTAPRLLPGPPVLGFVACGAVVRRSAFLQVGGFHDLLATGAEETLLAVDLASSGWDLAYVEDVVAHHHPSSRRDPLARRRAEARNLLWLAWLRRPLPTAVRRTARLARAGARDRPSRRALVDVVRAAPRLVHERRVAPAPVEAALDLLGL